MSYQRGSGPLTDFKQADDGHAAIVTGRWSSEVERLAESGEVDRLILNYARGFAEPDLEFLSSRLRIRELEVLDRKLTDLTPIYRLSSTLAHLSLDAAANADLDLGELPGLLSVSGDWEHFGATLGAVESLETVRAYAFSEIDLHALSNHVYLRHVSIKDATRLESLDGIGNLPDLSAIGIHGARKLWDISDVRYLGEPLREFELEYCPGVEDIDDVEPLVGLRFLGFSDSGGVASLAPLAPLQQLETFHAWGTTRVLDNDLSVLAELPRLQEIRMRDRATYRPRMSQLVNDNAKRVRD